MTRDAAACRARLRARERAHAAPQREAPHAALEHARAREPVPARVVGRADRGLDRADRARDDRDREHGDRRAAAARAVRRARTTRRAAARRRARRYAVCSASARSLRRASQMQNSARRAQRWSARRAARARRGAVLRARGKRAPRSRCATVAAASRSASRARYRRSHARAVAQRFAPLRVAQLLVELEQFELVDVRLALALVRDGRAPLRGRVGLPRRLGDLLHLDLAHRAVLVKRPTWRAVNDELRAFDRFTAMPSGRRSMTPRARSVPERASPRWCTGSCLDTNSDDAEAPSTCSSEGSRRPRSSSSRATPPRARARRFPPWAA